VKSNGEDLNFWFGQGLVWFCWWKICTGHQKFGTYYYVRR